MSDNIDKNETGQKRKDYQFTTPDGQIFEVPAEGSIGLLALGAVGLKAWRIARLKANKNTIDNPENTQVPEEE